MDRRGWIFLGGLAWLAAWLRLSGLERESLWLDELFTVRAATHRSWGELLGDLLADVHPPLWFGLLHLLPDLGDAIYRLPSALMGLVGVGLAGLLARALAGGGTHGQRALLLTVALTGTAPGLVLLDREARANGPLAALAVALVLLAVRPGRGWQAGLPLLAAVALVNLHPFGAFVVLGAVLFLLFDPGDGTGMTVRQGLGVAAAGVLGLLPWAGALRGQAGHFIADPWYQAPPGDSLSWVLSGLSDGQPGLLVVPLLGLAYALRQEGPGERRGLALVAAFAVSMVLVPQMLSYGVAPILRDRNAAPLLPLLLVAASVGLARAGRVGVTLGLVAAGTQALASFSATQIEWRREQWREAAAWAAERAEPGALVLANYPHLWRRYLPASVDLRDASAPDVDAAPGAVLLLAHDLTVPAAVATAPVLEEAAFLGATARAVGPISRTLALTVADPARGGPAGDGVALWGATGATSGELRARGDCAVAVRLREDPAGEERARVLVQLRANGALVIDEQLAVAEGEVRTQVAPGLFGEPGRVPLVLQLSFANDAVVDGADRNLYVDAAWLTCS